MFNFNALKMLKKTSVWNSYKCCCKISVTHPPFQPKMLPYQFKPSLAQFKCPIFQFTFPIYSLLSLSLNLFMKQLKFSSPILGSAPRMTGLGTEKSFNFSMQKWAANSGLHLRSFRNISSQFFINRITTKMTENSST